MKKAGIYFFLFFILSCKIFGQVQKDFDKIRLVQLEGMDSVLELSFDLIPEEVFDAFSRRVDPHVTIDPMNVVIQGDVTKLKTLHSYYVFDKSNDESLPYTYSGFEPSIRCHVISYCKEICEDFLLDELTDKKMWIPSSYDQGATELLFSRDHSMMLVYSSYDGNDFDKYYEHRGEIFFFHIKKGLGLKGIEFCGVYYTDDWSIEEISWIDENNIALKLYSENRYGDGSDLEFEYFKAKVNKP